MASKKEQLEDRVMTLEQLTAEVRRRIYGPSWWEEKVEFAWIFCAVTMIVLGFFQTAQIVGIAYTWTRDAFVSAVAERVESRISVRTETILLRPACKKTVGGLMYCR